jgi:antitoxin (DNA-binding transcriptional repressor) of toxin-antitoxin stability system
MEEMAISKFKAHCLEVIARVERTRKPVRITKRGKPVAEVNATTPEKKPKPVFGSMKGKMKILGDIISPVSKPEDWEALR